MVVVVFVLKAGIKILDWLIIDILEIPLKFFDTQECITVLLTVIIINT